MNFYIYFDQNGDILFMIIMIKIVMVTMMFLMNGKISCALIYSLFVTIPMALKSLWKRRWIVWSVELYYEMSDEYDGLPQINFPFNIILYFEAKWQWDWKSFGWCTQLWRTWNVFWNLKNGFDDNDHDWDWHEVECVELVYPISIENLKVKL